MNGCDYTVRLSYGVWQCMTEEQYQAHTERHPFQELPLFIGLPILLALGIAALVAVRAWVRSLFRGY